MHLLWQGEQQLPRLDCHHTLLCNCLLLPLRMHHVIENTYLKADVFQHCVWGQGGGLLCYSCLCLTLWCFSVSLHQVNIFVWIIQRQRAKQGKRQEVRRHWIVMISYTETWLFSSAVHMGFEPLFSVPFCVYCNLIYDCSLQTSILLFRFVHCHRVFFLLVLLNESVKSGKEYF